MVKKIIIPILFLVFVLSACSTNLHQAKMSECMKNQWTFNQETAPAFPLGKTAVWMNIETMNSDGTPESKWKWEPSDVNLARSYLDSLVKEKMISGYQFVKTSELPEKTPNGAAKKAGDDVSSVIIIKTLVETNYYFNPAAILDLTIICAYWLPASHREALSKTKIEFINLKNNSLVCASQGEGIAKICEPSFLIDTQTVVSDAKITGLRKSLQIFLKELRTMKK